MRDYTVYQLRNCVASMAARSPMTAQTQPPASARLACTAAAIRTKCASLSTQMIYTCFALERYSSGIDVRPKKKKKKNHSVRTFKLVCDSTK